MRPAKPNPSQRHRTRLLRRIAWVFAFALLVSFLPTRHAYLRSVHLTWPERLGLSAIFAVVLAPISLWEDTGHPRKIRQRILKRVRR